MTRCHWHNSRFSPDGEIIWLVLGKPRVGEEHLHEGPDVRGRLLGCADLEIAMREADTDWLVDVENVGFVIPRKRVESDRRAVVGDATWSVFLE